MEGPAYRWTCRLPKMVVREILTFFDCKKLFKDRIYALCRSLYFDDNFRNSLYSQMLMAKLGVVNDFAFELEYAQ